MEEGQYSKVSAEHARVLAEAGGSPFKEEWTPLHANRLFMQFEKLDGSGNMPATYKLFCKHPDYFTWHMLETPFRWNIAVYNPFVKEYPVHAESVKKHMAKF